MFCLKITHYIQSTSVVLVSLKKNWPIFLSVRRGSTEVYVSAKFKEYHDKTRSFPTVFRLKMNYWLD